MKKLLIIIALSTVGLVSCGTKNENNNVNTEPNGAVENESVEVNGGVVEDSASKWKENQPNIQILYSEYAHNMYEVAYNGETKPNVDNYSNDEEINMLMVDGGFVPHNEIIMVDDIAMIPTDKIEEVFGAEVTYNKDEDTVTLIKDDINIVFYISMGRVEVNGELYFEDTPIEINGEVYEEGATAFYRNSKIYVPLVFVAKVFESEVEYNEDLLFKLVSQNESKVDFYDDYKLFNIITIETSNKNKYEKEYSVEEGIEILKDSATDMYGESHIALTSKGEVDMWNLSYTGHNLGRYYVYVVDGLEDQLIYFNKYTSEVFSSPTGSIPYFMIIDGFLNIPQN